MATSGGGESLRYSGYRTPRRSRLVRGSVAPSLCHTPNTSPSKLGTAEAVTAVSAALTKTCRWHGSTRGLGSGGNTLHTLRRSATLLLSPVDGAPTGKNPVSESKLDQSL